MCITGVGFRLSAIGIAGSIDGEARDVEHFLIAFPQQCEQERSATSWLI